MAFDILLNKKVFHLDKDKLPCLIQYKEKTGGSQFSVTLIADLFLRGSKILFLTAYDYAKDNFFQQIAGAESKTICVENEDDLKRAAKFQAIIIKSGKEDLFLQALKTLPDINERIIFIKNIEIFNQEIINSSLEMGKIILSGDIDKCLDKKQIIGKLYKTIIAFSKPDITFPIEIPELEKYSGYFWNESRKGIVEIKIIKNPH
jgi:hypothetical protein